MTVRHSPNFKPLWTDLLLAIEVALYSRLNDLATIYTFQHPRFSTYASSKYDPCLLPLLQSTSLPWDSNKHHKDAEDNRAPLGLHLSPVTAVYSHPSKRPEFVDEHTAFFLLRVLDHDLSLAERLYIATSSKVQSLEPPDIVKGTTIKKPAIMEDDDDFVTPDGVPVGLELDIGGSHQQSTVVLDNDDLIARTEARTIQMDWLVELVNKDDGGSAALTFQDDLELIEAAVSQKLDAVRSGRETLLQLCGRHPFIDDVDGAASAVTAMLETIAHLRSNLHDPEGTTSEHWTKLSTSLAPQMCYAWGVTLEVNLSQVYERLKESQVNVFTSGYSQSNKVCDRAAAQICGRTNFPCKPYSECAY